MVAESHFTSLSCFVLIFFTKTIIPLTLMASESIAHEAELTQSPFGFKEYNNYYC